MSLIDIYAHVALPRFLSMDECLALMDREGVESAVLSTAETCPDTLGLSAALVAHPDRFRAIGKPVGRSPAHLRDAIRAQLDSGFSGIRLPAAFVAANPDVLDLIGAAGAIALVVGERGLSAAAGHLVDFLQRYPASSVIAGHFGGPTDPAILDSDPAVGALFDHPRLHVAFTRHGAMAHLPVEAWAAALVARCGWSRMLWGSEWPVALWRDETYASTRDWALRLAPSPADLADFHYNNAKRLLFSSGSVAARPLAPEWDVMDLRRPADVWLFPPSLDVSEERHRGLMAAYVAWGGERRGRYSEFMLAMAERGIAATFPG